MAELTRRSLLEASAAGAVAAGAAAGMVPAGWDRAAGRGAPLSLPRDVVVHVADAGRAEVAVLAGTRELLVRDEELVARIAALVARAEGR